MGNKMVTEVSNFMHQVNSSYLVSANHYTLQFFPAVIKGTEAREKVLAAVGSPPFQAIQPSPPFRLGLPSIGSIVGGSRRQQSVSPCPCVKDSETVQY